MYPSHVKIIHRINTATLIPHTEQHDKPGSGKLLDLPQVDNFFFDTEKKNFSRKTKNIFFERLSRERFPGDKRIRKNGLGKV